MAVEISYGGSNMKGNLTDNEIFRQLRENQDVLKKYRVKRIGLFGSYARGTQKKSSDIDFLVEFKKPDFDNFMDLVSFLEDLFGRRVEILTPDGVRSIRIKAIAKEIERSVVYG